MTGWPRPPIQRRDRDDGWLAVFFEFWAHVLRHPELRERFAAIHARFLEPLTEAVRQLAEDRGLALPSDVTASQVALAWNAMEVGLGLERLTQPQTVDGVLARRMGWLLLDAVVGAAQPSAGNDGTPAGSEDPMNSTQVRYHRRRLADVAAALRLARTQTSREQRATRPARPPPAAAPGDRRPPRRHPLAVLPTAAGRDRRPRRRPGRAGAPARARQVAAHGALRRAGL